MHFDYQIDGGSHGGVFERFFGGSRRQMFDKNIDEILQDFLRKY